MARRTGTSWEIDVDLQGVDDQLREARKLINKRVKEGLSEAGRYAILPYVRADAAGDFPKEAVAAITTKATSRRGYVTTRGSRTLDRIVGLLNFGGLITTPIYPTDAQAIKVGNTGELRAVVRGFRRYRGKHVIERAMQLAVPKMEDVMSAEIMHAFDGLPHT